ncbi:hypothetical protein [Halococcus saccharolyticus]|uniref:Uncharacterized protein n=1 Tax=Halococcus saccharolyticus DSM 5350 TaxID=1227455 RepID=M0MLX8_9EURY|nr:hypothetical protein [Halococcus saccharolyticus]EMA46692.1 hypothetical protein C449_03461 [Halococcus saccharolyticus DSM 5350]
MVLLSQVVTRLGSLAEVTPQTMENLFAADLAHLQDMYERINDRGMNTVEAVWSDCGESFAVEVGVGSDTERSREMSTTTDGSRNDRASVTTDVRKTQAERWMVTQEILAPRQRGFARRRSRRTTGRVRE